MITCPHCGKDFEREVKVNVHSAAAGRIEVVVTDNAGDVQFEKQYARAVGKLLIAIAKDMGTPMKMGKVRTSEPMTRSET